MKLNHLIILTFAFTILSGNSFADELKNKDGKPSSRQSLTCDSREQNLSISIAGDHATIENNDFPGEYTCTGSITSASVDLVCTVNPGQEVPEIFTMGAVPGLNRADYTSTGTPGVSHGECQF